MAKETRDEKRRENADKGNEGVRRSQPSHRRAEGDPAIPDDAGRAAIPEILRRAMALGLTGFFTTEEALRKALGDTLPRDWVDFASSQSERTRDEMLDRVALEFGRVLDSVDIVDVLGQLLEGHTLEVKAEVKLTPREDGARGGRTKTKLQVAGERKKDT